jgi:hypothetical protein
VFDTAASYSRSAADRVDWDTVQSYSKNALERVTTLATKSKDSVEKKTTKAD